MTPGEIEKNLLLLLDPTSAHSEELWSFVDWQTQHGKSSHRSSAGSVNRNQTVYCFGRREIIGFLIFPWYARIRGYQGKVRQVLYMNDGLLSSLFDADKSAGYRAFAARHLPQSGRLRQRLRSLLPPLLKAEKRYAVVSDDSGHKEEPPCAKAAGLKKQDFMFFSNAAGKLLMTTAKTLSSGNGSVFKTTVNPSYAGVMEKEFATMRCISRLQSGAASLPRVGARLKIGERLFFTEEYVTGISLREVLHNLSHRNDMSGLCEYLDRLDAWFANYCLAFGRTSQPLKSCYSHLLAAFSGLYGERLEAGLMLEEARGALSTVSRNLGSVPTIIAHNDLWPGNFIVCSADLIAVDWERAVENRAPFFDYYWMIISATLEYHVCCIGVVDYSRAFRLFLKRGDPVSRHAVEKLFSYLERLGFAKTMHQYFLLLFLMEWSVQGYLALGKQTAMDRLAFGELLKFTEETLAEHNCSRTELAH